MKKLFLAILFLIISWGARAQVMSSQSMGADSVSTAIIPVISYSTDLGFIFGGIYSRYDYTGNTMPFNNLKQAKALISTKGYINAQMLYEKTNSFGSDIRTIASAYGYRFGQDTYFGIGNTTTYSQQRWDNDYYFFESISFGLEFKIRKPVYRKQRGQFDVSAGLGYDYQIAYINQQNSSFNQMKPNGSDGGFVNYAIAGFVWENRDSEFDPNVGNRAELEIRYAPKYLSEYPLTTARLDLRQYVHFFDFITLAGRVEGRHVGGNVPYWELSTLGDDYSLRGYPLNRFKGNSSLAYNLELRIWLIELPDYGIKIGGHGFADGGRVFTGQDNFNDIFKRYKHTFGVGGAFSAFSPDFILRGELGFSEDATQLYVGVGYMF